MIVVEVMSRIDKFPRKKYIGVCRWLSRQISSRMVKLPISVIRYIVNTKRNIVTCNSGTSVIPFMMKYFSVV